MPIKLRGVMQSPVTPLKADFSLDLEKFEKLLDFHVRTSGTAISWPHHKGESLNMSIAERKRGAEAAVKAVAGRVGISIHVSALSVEDSLDLARHAEKIGADAIIAITPYFWNPTKEAIYEHFVRLGTATSLPIIAYNSPSYLSGIEFDGELLARLVERLPNLIGMKEASFNSEKFIELSRAVLGTTSPNPPVGGTGLRELDAPPPLRVCEGIAQPARASSARPGPEGEQR